jgi:hydroxyacylglutathione hydrolase
LQFTDRKEFIANVAKKLEKPPYFSRMEAWNVAGAPLMGPRHPIEGHSDGALHPIKGHSDGALHPIKGHSDGALHPIKGHSDGALPIATPLSPEAFAEKARDAVVLDTRMELGFAAAHVPDAISIWMEGVPRFAGWFLPYDRPILLVTEMADPTPVVRALVRIGYDNVVGSLAGGMLAWHMAGRESASIRTTTVQGLCRLLDAHGEPWILDVRSDAEVEAGPVPDAHHIHLTQLPRRLDAVPEERSIHVFCGSGLRSMVAASLLRRQGWEDLVVVLGGLAGWRSTTCPLEL